MGQSYLLRRDGRDYQAQDLDTMRQWARDGRVLPSDMVYSPRYQSWYRARDLRELRDVLPNVDAPPPQAAPPPAVRPPQQFWLRKGDQNYAADGLDTILRWASEGNISPDDFIYHPAYGKWFRAGDSPQLANRFPDHIKRTLPFLPPGDDPMRSASNRSAVQEPGPTQMQPQVQPPLDAEESDEYDLDEVESADSMARTVMDFKAADLQRALAAREAELAKQKSENSQPGSAAPTVGAGGGVRRVDATTSNPRLSASRPTPAPTFNPDPQIGHPGLDSVDEPTRPIDGPLGKPRPSGAAVVKPRRTGRFAGGESKQSTNNGMPSVNVPSKPAAPAPPEDPHPDSVEMLDPDMVEEVHSLPPEGAAPERNFSATTDPEPEPTPQPEPEPEPEVQAAPEPEPEPEPEPAPELMVELDPTPVATIDPNARFVDRQGLMKLFYDVARVFVVTKDLRPGELLEASCKLASTGDEFLGQAKRAIYHQLAKRMREHMAEKVLPAENRIQADNMAGYRLFVQRAQELIDAYQIGDEHIGRKPPERVVIGNAARPKLTPQEEEALIRIDSALKALISIRQKASEAA